MKEGRIGPAGVRLDEKSGFLFLLLLLQPHNSNDRSAMPAFTQLPVHGDGDDDSSPPASPHLPALEYGAAAGAAALGGDGGAHSDEEDVLMADGSRSRAHSHSLQRSPQVGGGAAAGWSMDSAMRESFAGQAAGSMRGGGRARLQPPQSDEEELKEEKREEPGTSQKHMHTNRCTRVGSRSGPVARRRAESAALEEARAAD